MYTLFNNTAGKYSIVDHKNRVYHKYYETIEGLLSIANSTNAEWSNIEQGNSYNVLNNSYPKEKIVYTFDTLPTLDSHPELLI
jgi:uncharacterized protein YaiE (UPF0345 family)